jgi:hypothetical protein
VIVGEIYKAVTSRQAALRKIRQGSSY